MSAQQETSCSPALFFFSLASPGLNLPGILQRLHLYLAGGFLVAFVAVLSSLLTVSWLSLIHVPSLTTVGELTAATCSWAALAPRGDELSEITMTSGCSFFGSLVGEPSRAGTGAAAGLGNRARMSSSA